MSRGPGRIEQRIGELFAATKDRARSVSELAAHAFALSHGIAPDRKQRLSATRAAHRLLRRAAAVTEALDTSFRRASAETTVILGREPGGRGREAVYHFQTGLGTIAVDAAFAKAMKNAPSWLAYQQAWPTYDRERKRFDGFLAGRWRATETKAQRLWFHRADFPMRVWAVAIRPEGVIWAEAEIVRIDNTYVFVQYRDEPARLDREKLAQHWTLYRNVYFTSMRSGFAAQAFDQMWRERYWRPGSAVPPAMQMELGHAIKLLGVPKDFIRDDVITAFRRKAHAWHPDHGGTAEAFQALVQARDRLLAALGTRAAAPKMPEFAPKGMRLRLWHMAADAWSPD